VAKREKYEHGDVIYSQEMTYNTTDVDVIIGLFNFGKKQENEQIKYKRWK